MERSALKSVGAWVRNLLALGTVAALGYIAEKGADGGFIKDVWAQAKTASPLAAMLAIMMWLDERKERRDAQKQCYERTVDFIQSTNLQTTTSAKGADALTTLAHGFEKVAIILGLSNDDKKPVRGKR